MNADVMENPGMNPKWPAIRDELDAAVHNAMVLGDLTGWVRACRERVYLGGHVDPPKRFVVTASFAMRHVLDCSDPCVNGRTAIPTICGIPIVVEGGAECA